jgi:hypothetical protein
MIGAARLRRRPSAKIDQAQNSTPVHPTNGLDDVALVEGGDQALQRLRGIPLARDIFTENGPCSLQRTQDGFLVVDKQKTHLVRAPAHIGRTEADTRSIWRHKKAAVRDGPCPNYGFVPDEDAKAFFTAAESFAQLHVSEPSSQAVAFD